ncbi:hypothetical protein [Clostridium perfringens]|uniref:hypothetical protein n=1 Tax=Clostridium perfringens TaxID=1502 RepID=UPI00096AA81C|nr:hypothetical protein [Clostridium perfringens]ELC8386010.1 hypothetical protein [Clostridium perfringens]VTQ55143.1 Uncharacterised protein [Clostridium perfringens]
MKNYASDIVVAQILDEYTLVLNKGANDGIKKEQQFLIYELSENDIIDPITKKSLGKLEIIKGTGIVTHLQDKICTIHSSNYQTSLIAKMSLLGASTSKNNTLPFNKAKIGDLAKPL